MFTKFIATVASAALLVAAVSTAPAMAAHPPLGMQIFCVNHASSCKADSRSSVEMSDRLMGMLSQVNSSVNRSMRYRAESGPIDNWKIGGSSGDCEDYALTKRSRLISKGVPAGALRIATTYTRRGEPHAILVVKTTAGDFVLDNLAAEVKTRSSAGYRLRSISTADPRVWSAG